MNDDLRTFYRLVRRTRAGVLDWLAGLPPEVLVREHPDFAFGSLVRIYSHVADTYMGWVGEVGLGQEERPLEARDVTELRQAFQEVDTTVERALDSFSTPDEPFDRSSGGFGVLTLTGRWLLLHPITHEFHHKGQALALARMLGYPHPGNPDTDLTWPGPLAEDD